MLLETTKAIASGLRLISNCIALINPFYQVNSMVELLVWASWRDDVVESKRPRPKISVRPQQCI